MRNSCPTLKLDGGGRTIRSVKDQLNRLAAADFRFYVKYQDHAVTVKGTVIEGLDLWVSKDERQRVLWPSVVQFSQRYFQSLCSPMPCRSTRMPSPNCHTAPWGSTSTPGSPSDCTA